MGLYEILPEKDTTRHKTLETMCNVRAWPQQCWKSCENIYPTLLRFASAITEHKQFWELLA